MGTVRHPTSCRGFTVRYQWVAEMCQYRRTEADIVGILIGFTDSQFEKNKKNHKESEDGEWVDLSMALLSAMTSESVRSVQYAMRWLEAHQVVSVEARTSTNGMNRKRSYKLNLELLDKVVATRDLRQAPVSLVLIDGVPSVVLATEVQKLQGPVQKLQGRGAKIAS